MAFEQRDSGVFRRRRVLGATASLLVVVVLLVVSTAGAQLPDGLRGDDSSDGPDGRWRMARPEHRAAMTDAQRAEVERLNSIGYLSGSQAAPEASGVTIHDASRVEPGINLVLSGHRPGAALIDMDGRVLHDWSLSFLDVWGSDREEADEENAQYWRAAHLFENGDIIAIFEGLGMIKVDAGSNIIWSRRNNAHHDLQVLDDGRICTLTREAHIVRRVNPNTPILEDFVEILDAEGNSLRRVSVLEAFENSAFSNATGVLGMRRIGDIFHTNSVEFLDGSLADRLPAFKKGNVLVSLRKLSIVAVIDMDREEVVWALSGLWKAQHMPRMIPGGTMMVFDNSGNDGRSRIVEFDPVTQSVEWVYKGETPEEFYTQMCGANHRLPNGNTLIVESDFGRVFEVTGTGETVWEFINPERAGRKQELIGTLFDVRRIPPGFSTSWASGR